ncbi:sulfotransferase domain-containing protein [Roseibium sp. RKSG952]|uniref:sulfotransferase domain-containing protein n=1 Tax=Roseibium sp. RKSG952 TaxID=2529384 RepID=UPI0012BC58ED|nr:sulfotransferase domain-containing protein [Roseibium sp. RKSG952]MTH96498.1 sulfotransferase domain-containing protein [Roseibium sp. RKSG952]
MCSTGLLPEKTRELHNHHFDSTVWNDFRFRRDDIIMASYCKSGSTWMQQIVGQLIFDGDPDVSVADLSPWLDLRVPSADMKLAALEVQTYRRFIKTHLPVDALVFSDTAKYTFIARDGRDVVWSLWNHYVNANDMWYSTLNDAPGRVRPALQRPTGDAVDFFRNWLARDGEPFWSIWDTLRSWWALRELPNVFFIHSADLKADREAAIRRLADFLEMDKSDAVISAAVAHSGFDWMKANAEKAAPLRGIFWEGGAQSFIYKGTNNRWQGILPDEDSKAYEARAEAELGPACAHWLKTGELPA